jgi:hypothetical protein
MGYYGKLEIPTLKILQERVNTAQSKKGKLRLKPRKFTLNISVL